MARWKRRRSAFLAALALWLGLLPSVAFAAPAVTTPANIYLVAIGDNGMSGIPIGCGDSLVPVPVILNGGTTLEERITLALNQLFSIHTPNFGQSGLVTVLANSQLTVDRVRIENGVAAVYLSGTLSLGGVCDDPRANGQINATAGQFPGVSRVEVVFNGGPLTNEVGELTFPQVPYSIQPPFFPYWQNQGGLPIFGYPLSKQTVEAGFRTQYFERQRMESHPENTAPYNILLGLVGDETAARLGLLGTTPFAPVASAPSGCEYFPVTRHSVCGDFLTYWHGHGLDFGDPGFSFRESLALFGYPISQPFSQRLEDGNTYTVQYFERVRMEFHPANPVPYKVLLGRLTADLVPADAR